MMPTMKKSLVFMVVACCTLFASAKAAVVPESWKSTPLHFKTEAQMRPDIQRYAKDARMTYYLILRAYNIGTLKSAVLTYYKLMESKPSDPYLRAAFAFSHFMATEYHFDRWPKPDADLNMIEAGVDASRDMSVRMLSGNSAILLMAARAQFFSNAVGVAEAIPEMRKGLSWGQKAVAKDRRWAESHYWLARMWHYFAMNNIKASKAQKASWNRLAFSSSQNALRLGGKPFEAPCYLDFSYYYIGTEQWRAALKYLDMATALLPNNHINRRDFAATRKALLEAINNQQRSDR